MITLAEIGPGQRILDVATGLGEPALTVARRIAPSGRVDAIDSSEAMLAHARERAARLGLDKVAFEVMAGENLAYRAASFDALLCRWGLMFLNDLPRTLAGFRRILVPGGRLVAAVWGPPERVPAVSLSGFELHRVLGLPAPAQRPMSAFALSDTEALCRGVEEAGFRDVRGEWLKVEFLFESVEAVVAFRKDGRCRCGPNWRASARPSGKPPGRRSQRRRGAMPAATAGCAWATMPTSSRRGDESGRQAA